MTWVSICASVGYAHKVRKHQLFVYLAEVRQSVCHQLFGVRLASPSTSESDGADEVIQRQLDWFH